MNYFYLFYLLFASCYAVPIIPQIGGINNVPSYYGVDLAVATSFSQFSCIKTNGYQAVFIRAYNPAGNGAFDVNAPLNINNAHNAGLGTEVYMTPQPKSNKKGYQQFDEFYNGLQSKGISIYSLWIQVTSPVNWLGQTSQNIDFINSILSRGRQHGIYLGIYTNYYDWNQITAGWSAGSDTMLWYWNVFGSGIGGESKADFEDFRPFGSWLSPTVKQFGQVETLCGITVNRDIYVAAASSPKIVNAENTTKLEKLEMSVTAEKTVLSVGHIGIS